MNLDLFFIYDVFFFGTALNIDSHIDSTKPGTLRWIAEGMANAGRSGWDNCREYRAADFEAMATFDGARRGRKDERMEEVVACIVAILTQLID